MDNIKKWGGRILLQKLAVGLIIVLVVGMSPLIFLTGTPLPDRNNQQGDIQLLQIPQIHNTDEEMIVRAHQTTVYVPEDVMNLSGNIVISPRQPDLFSFALEFEWSRPIMVNIEYWNEEDVHYSGITFSEPIRVCFALSPEQWKDFTGRPENYQVQYFDSRKLPSRWITMPMVMEPDRYELCTQTDHLSLYALAIRSAKSIPVTGITLAPTATSTPTVFNSSDHRHSRDSEDKPVATVQPPQPTKPPIKTPKPTKPPTKPPTEPPPTEPPTEETPDPTEEIPDPTEEIPDPTEEIPDPTEETPDPTLGTPVEP